MKNITKALLVIVLFFIGVGSIGALDNSTISWFQCFMQCGLCSIGSYLLMKGWCK